MREPFSWVKRVFGGKTDVMTLLTPESARTRNPVVRIALAGVTAAGLAMASAVGIVSLAALIFAVGVIYFLSTQVLGLKIDVDPRAFYEKVQKQAAAYGPN
jgi:hypothetical protein